MKKMVSFEEFSKNGTSKIVTDHYSGSTTKVDDLSDPKDATVKGGSIEHTEQIKADDLSDPKNANESKINEEIKNPNIKLIGTQQTMLEISGPVEATVFEIDLDHFLKAEKITKDKVKIKNIGKEKYFDTF